MKLYKIGFYTSKDEELINSYKWYKIQKDNAITVYKEFCNSLREIIGTDNIIGLCFNEKEQEVGIAEYPIKSTANNYFDQHYDKDLNDLYIEVEDE